LISGNACSSDLVAGCKSFPNVVKSVKNGCCTRSELVDVVNVEGDSAIVDSSALGERSIAANVVAMFVNKSALTCATGATVRMNVSNAVKNRVNCVDGALKFAATGRRYPNNDGRSSSV
jgi:hypothetical protein